MKRYDDDKKYKSVPNFPDGISNENDKMLWRGVCKHKLNTPEGLKGSDLEDVRKMINCRRALDGFSVDIRHCNERFKIMDLALYGKFAQQFRDCKKRLFGDEDALIGGYTN